MKYTKVNYYIIGRFENGNKYGLVTRQEVTGYTAEGLEGVAIRKRADFWYVDHVSTGLGVVTVGLKTREAAAKEYTEHYKNRIEAMTPEMLKAAAKSFEDAPEEKTVSAWESINYSTTYNWRLDRVTTAAGRAGLIVKKADNVSYLDGGNINIIGDPAELEKIREIIARFEAKTERPETISNAEPSTEEAAALEETRTEQNSGYTFTPASITKDGSTYPAEYNMIANGSVLVFAITGTKADGRKEKERFCFAPDDTNYTEARAAAMDAIENGFGHIYTTTPGTSSETAPAPEARKAAPAAEPIEGEAPARDPKQARGPVPEKTFVGEEIRGAGWKIYFDGEKNRTRVIFDGIPTAAAKAAVEEAGFWFSAAMNSWNKKLTFKAYRAAKALAGELERVCAA